MQVRHKDKRKPKPDPTVLDLVSTGKKYFNHFPYQFSELITDGRWAIRREFLVGRTDLPSYILAMLNARHQKTDYTGSRFGELVKFSKDMMAELFLAEIDGSLRMLTGSHYAMAVATFKDPNSDKKITVDAHIAKMLKIVFPNAQWYGFNKNRPLILFDNLEVVAILMPVQLKEER